MENIQKPSSEPKPSQTDLQEEKQSKDHRQGKEEETGTAPLTDKQTVQNTVNKQ